MNRQQQTLVTDLLHHDDLQERLSAVVERTRRLPHFTASERAPHHRVPGCSSSVWLISELKNGLCHFRSDADSPVVRGLVALLSDYFTGLSPRECLDDVSDPLDLLDLKRGLSPTRRHGLAAVTAALRRFAQDNLPTTTSPAAIRDQPTPPSFS